MDLSKDVVFEENQTYLNTCQQMMIAGRSVDDMIMRNVAVKMSLQ